MRSCTTGVDAPTARSTCRRRQRDDDRGAGAADGSRGAARAGGGHASPTPRRKTPNTEMTFLGLVGMIDPPRPEAKAAIETCERAGIKPVMITGDHPLTAQAIARELGLLKQRPRRHRRRVGGSRARTTFQREVEAIEVYAACLAGAQAARGHGAAEARPHRRHDRRRRQRCAGAQEGRHRHCHGHHRHRCDQGSGGDDADRRQFRVDRRGGARKAAASLATSRST